MKKAILVGLLLSGSLFANKTNESIDVNRLDQAGFHILANSLKRYSKSHKEINLHKLSNEFIKSLECNNNFKLIMFNEAISFCKNNEKSMYCIDKDYLKINKLCEEN